MPPGAPPPVLFGKLPDRADFVRQGGPSPALDALDALVQKALRQRLPSAEGPLLRFVYNPPEGPHALAGALQLSHDRVGRQYPLVVARPVERGTLDPAAAPSWPLRWAEVFDEAAVIVRGAVDGHAPFADVSDRMVRMPEAQWAVGRSPSVDRHVRAAEALPARVFFERIPGGEPHAIRILQRLVTLLRRATVPGYGVRVPLPATADGFGLADGVSFWLAAGAHLMRARPPWPTILWTEATPAGPGALVVFYGGISALALRWLLAGVADPDTVVSLAVGSDPVAARGVPPALAQLLADPTASVADVLVRLHALV